jgi:hypothetical protein
MDDRLQLKLVAVAVRRWRLRMIRRPGVGESGLPMAQIQREYPGLWVAVKGRQVIDARQTPYELIMRLNEKGVRDATVFRCPAADEPELVGLG